MTVYLHRDRETVQVAIVAGTNTNIVNDIRRHHLCPSLSLPSKPFFVINLLLCLCSLVCMLIN